MEEAMSHIFSPYHHYLIDLNTCSIISILIDLLASKKSSAMHVMKHEELSPSLQKKCFV